MKIKILVGVLIFLIIVNFATIGTYVYFRITGPPFSEFQNRPSDLRMPPPIRELGDKEREEMFKLMRDFIDETRTMRDSVRALDHELFQLFQQDPVPQETIEAKLRDIAEVKIEISKKAAARFIQAKTFLTPQQQERFFNSIMQSQPEFGPGWRPPHGRFDARDSLHGRPPEDGRREFDRPRRIP
jgi:Spy/CpxP family protein refolding chaperone